MHIAYQPAVEAVRDPLAVMSYRERALVPTLCVGMPPGRSAAIPEEARN
jgi:hypothetical protein